MTMEKKKMWVVVDEMQDYSENFTNKVTGYKALFKFHCYWRMANDEKHIKV